MNDGRTVKNNVGWISEFDEQGVNEQQWMKVDDGMTKDDGGGWS
jgi:hypothetical protein